MNKICICCGNTEGHAHEDYCAWYDCEGMEEEDAAWGYVQNDGTETLIRLNFNIMPLTTADAEDFCRYLDDHCEGLKHFVISFDRKSNSVTTICAEYGDDAHKLARIADSAGDININDDFANWLKGRCYALEEIKEQL